MQNVCLEKLYYMIFILQNLLETRIVCKNNTQVDNSWKNIDEEIPRTESDVSLFLEV